MLNAKYGDGLPGGCTDPGRQKENDLAYKDTIQNFEDVYERVYLEHYSTGVEIPVHTEGYTVHVHVPRLPSLFQSVGDISHK
jgi:hypothetical protein